MPDAESTAAAARRKDRIDALVLEREGYVRQGKTDRVKAVDAALKDAGYKAPSGRSSKPKSEG